MIRTVFGGIRINLPIIIIPLVISFFAKTGFTASGPESNREFQQNPTMATWQEVFRSVNSLQADFDTDTNIVVVLNAVNLIGANNGVDWKKLNADSTLQEFMTNGMLSENHRETALWLHQQFLGGFLDITQNTLADIARVVVNRSRLSTQGHLASTQNVPTYSSSLWMGPVFVSWSILAFENESEETRTASPSTTLYSCAFKRSGFLLSVSPLARCPN